MAITCTTAGETIAVPVTDGSQTVTVPHTGAVVVTLGAAIPTMGILLLEGVLDGLLLEGTSDRLLLEA